MNIPKESLPIVFREMFRALQTCGLLLLGFHIGDETVHFDKLWERSVLLDFFYYQPAEIRRLLEDVGFKVDGVFERDPYAPEVEHQSRRAYVFARKPSGGRKRART